MKKKRNGVAIFIILIIALFAVSFYWLVGKIYPLNFTNYINKYSKEYNIDPFFVAALIKAESNFKVEAKSHKNANGLMQITGSTGEWIASMMKIDNYTEAMLYDPETNIRMGCWYINDLRKEFGNSTELILAAYNAGRGNVNSWLQNEKYSKDGKKLDYIPFKETDQYIKRIKTNYNIYKLLYKKELGITENIK
ncbi:lytic transglycosylase domain-containing protein [Clostridium thermarum]|uniref:lytic transglycosylase domain-containing protein n=1 Tax=Clostridium thermarum TaxID=1716543 RepID=UPI0013D221C6|nr:lytic transglycosylase domain-containing protein [Clostridium thermarum]